MQLQPAQPGTESLWKLMQILSISSRHSKSFGQKVSFGEAKFETDRQFQFWDGESKCKLKKNAFFYLQELALAETLSVFVEDLSGLA